jgi:phosphate acetyltransferase
MPSRPHFQRFASEARLLPPLPAAVVFPCDRESLQFALSGAFAGYLAPVLVGPLARIRATADAAGLDIARLPAVDTTDDPRAAAQRAVELARSGEVAAIVKGALGNDELLSPVVAPDTGLRGDRRLSHGFVLDLPGRPEHLLIADALLNVNPNLAAKKDIALNTIEFAVALGVRHPRVALVAAVDGVSPTFPSTADAAALKSMAAQGLLGDAIVDGPLTADCALSADAARAAGVRSDVAGRPDVIIAPCMETAAILLRTLTAATGGFAAGLVLGARVPILTPQRSDSIEVRVASCVLAALHAAARGAERSAEPPGPGTTRGVAPAKSTATAVRPRADAAA